MNNSGSPVLITREWTRSVLPKRSLEANKGTFGRVLVVAGSLNYTGAAYLACSGAMRVGAGLVTLATSAGIYPILASKLIETTFLTLPETSPGIISSEAADIVKEELKSSNALLIGCGLGRKPATARFIESLLYSGNLLPTVIDADALNALSGIDGWWQKVAFNAILTPHPGEMSRLTGISVEEIQSNRADIAGEMAIKWNKTVILKGAQTIVAGPDGHVRMSEISNPGLATAGTGDVLAGMIAGLLAQGQSMSDAAACGVFVHAMAGETVKNALGDAGMLASDLLPALPVVIKRLKESS